MRPPRIGFARPTLVAWLTGFSAIAMLLAALNVQNGWLYLIDAWTWGVLVGSLAFVIPARRHRITCHFPAQATEGEPISCQLTLESQSPLTHVEVRFHQSRLLLSRDRCVQIQGDLPAMARGIHPLPPAVVVRWSPAGLFWRPEYHAPFGNVRVYPRLEELASWPWLALTGSQTQDPSQSVREYRSGDPKRWIHWPTSARRDRLFVRESHPSGGNQLALWLHAPIHSNQGQGPDATLEIAVRSLGSLAQFLLEKGFRVWVGRSGHTDWLEIHHRHELLEWLLPLAESDSQAPPPPKGFQEVVFSLTEDVVPLLAERTGRPIVYLCRTEAESWSLPPTPFPLLVLSPEQSLAQLVQSR